MSALTPRLDRLEKNVIINGNFDVWQRGSSFTGVTGNALYSADRWNVTRGASVTGLVHSITQSTDVPTVAQSGFASVNSFLFTTTTAATNMSSSANVVGPTYHVEGYDLQRLVGQTINVSFWVKSTITGTFSLGLFRQFTDSYVATYTINSASTWEKKTVSVYIDPTIAWSTNSGLTNGRGIILLWTLGCATSLQTSSLNQWLVATGAYQSSTSTNGVVNTLNATFQLAQVMVSPAGSQSTFTSTTNVFSRAGSSFEHEFAMCRRYFRKDLAAYGKFTSTTSCQLFYTFQPEMRAVPVPYNAGVLLVTDSVAADFTQSSWNLTDSGLNARGGRTAAANFSGASSGLVVGQYVGGANPSAFDAEL